MEQRERGQVGDRELGLKGVGDVVLRSGLARDRVDPDGDPPGRRTRGAKLERRLDCAVGREAARIGLDPVQTHRRLAFRNGPASAEGLLVAGRAARDGVERCGCARGGQARRLDPGGGGAADLDRLAVRAERGPQPARVEDRERGPMAWPDRRGEAAGRPRRRRRRCRRRRSGASRARRAPDGSPGQGPLSPRSPPRTLSAPLRGRPSLAASTSTAGATGAVACTRPGV